MTGRNGKEKTMSGHMLILGAGGNLGKEIERAARASQKWQVTTALHGDCDITDRKALENLLDVTKPDLVVSAAAMTKVDQAEQDPDKAFFVNAWGSQMVAEACRRAKARLVSFSTDFVFDGEQRQPYCEEDEAKPLSRYGQSKLAGDKAVLAASPDNLVLRVGNLYGSFGRNLPARLPALLRQGPRPRLDSERTMAPTWSKSVADQLMTMLSAQVPGGLYHVACRGAATWAEFGRELAAHLGMEIAFDEVRSADLGLAAARPAYSVLRNRHLEWLGLDHMPHWRDALKSWVNEEIKIADTLENDDLGADRVLRQRRDDLGKPERD